jgi:hypothetical protein
MNGAFHYSIYNMILYLYYDNDFIINIMTDTSPGFLVFLTLLTALQKKTVARAVEMVKKSLSLNKS